MDPIDEEKNIDQYVSKAFLKEKFDLKLGDIGGLENEKNTLKETIILPLKFPSIFTGIRRYPRTILLYGPHGAGKTFLINVCARETDASYFEISCSELVSKYFKESEKIIWTVFNMAREKKPSIIFLDDLESLNYLRSDGNIEATRRILIELLYPFQNIEGIYVLGATWMPWGIISHLRRRF